MSDMWLYDENRCEGHFCPKDCDNCSYAEEEDGEDDTVD